MSAATGMPRRRMLDPARAAGRLRATGIALPFAALFITLSIASSSFLTKVNLLNILDQQSATLIIAAAGTLVLVAGGIDLSVGAVYALAGVTGAEMASRTSPAVAIALGVCVGLAVGLVNGLVVTRLRINALIATLAMSFVVSGLATLVTHGNLVVLFEHPEFGDLARTQVFGVKTSIWIAIVAVVVWIRFAYAYVIEGDGAGHVQSLILGAVLFNAAALLFALGIIGDLLYAQRVLSQRTLERVRRVELQLGVAPSHYEPGARDTGQPATTGAASGEATGKTGEHEAVRITTGTR